MMEKIAYLAFVVLGISGTVHGMALPFLIDKFQLPLSLAGFIFVAGSLGYILASSTYPWWEKHLSTKEQLSLGAWLFSLSSLFLPLAPIWSLTVVAAFIGGFGTGTIDVGFNTVIASLEMTRAKAAMNWLHFAFSFGALSGPLLLSRVLAATNWWWMYFTAAALFVVVSVLWQTPNITLTTNRATNGEEESPTVSPYRHSSFWLLAIAMVIYCGAEVALAGWITTYFNTRFSLPVEQASIGITMLWLGLAIGRGLCGRIAPLVSSKRLLLVLNLGSACFVALTAQATHSLSAIIYLFFAGLFFSGIFPALVLQGTEIFPASPGKISSGLVTSAGIGGLLIPGLLGVIADMGGLNWGFWLIGASFIIALITVLFVAPLPQPKQQGSALSHH